MTITSVLAVALLAGSTPTVEASAAQAVECPTVSNDNLSPEQMSLVRSTVREVCSIFGSEEFEAAVKAQEQAWLAENPKHTWIAACRGFLFSAKDRVEATTIVHELRNNMADFTISHGTFRNSRVNAVVSLGRRELKIRTDRIDLAVRGDSESRARLANTIAHEMTHLVPMSTGSGTPLFRDRGFSSPFCPNGRLVSYGIERIAEAQWREIHLAP